MYLNGHGIAGKDARGSAITDDHFLLYFNADGPADGDPAAGRVRRGVGRRHRHRRRRADDASTHAAGSTFHARARAACGAPRARRARGRARPLGGRLAGRPVGRQRLEATPAQRTAAHGSRLTRMRTPEQHLPAPDHRASSTCSRRRRRLPYLHDLGVDWVYLSPLLAAEPGSDHGYDVVAHDRVDPSRGGAEGLAALSAEARRLGMGVLVDIVPNHVGVATPRRDAVVVGRARARPRVRARRGVRHRLGRPATAGSGSRSSATTTRTPRRPDRAPARWWTASCATTTTASRSRPARRRPRPTTARDADTVHDRQHYELVNWRRGRRRAELPPLLRGQHPGRRCGSRTRRCSRDSHVEIRRWFDEGLVDGLRVDHPDGLRDPRRYLDDLAELTGGAYVLVEKILEPGEELPGVVGDRRHHRVRRARRYIDRVLTDPAGQQPLDALETRLRGAPVDWHELIHDTKRAVADGILHSEVSRIAREVRATLAPTAAAPTDASPTRSPSCWPASRSTAPTCPRAASTSTQAFALAPRAPPRPGRDARRAACRCWPTRTAAPAQRFQQTSGMVMAKGVEDCAFYRYSRLTSLNEVGGDPSDLRDHARASSTAAWPRRQAEWPRRDDRALDPRHQARRGRPRPDHRAGRDPRRLGGARSTSCSRSPRCPTPASAACCGRPSLGAWPRDSTAERLHGYAEKAMREAGDRTTWTAPDEDYEAAVHAAVDAALRRRAACAAVLDDAGGPDRRRPAGATRWPRSCWRSRCPACPDVYQGSELWEQSLVDPDNRRPVDFDRAPRPLGALARGRRAPAHRPPSTTRAPPSCWSPARR